MSTAPQIKEPPTGTPPDLENRALQVVRSLPLGADTQMIVRVMVGELERSWQTGYDTGKIDMLAYVTGRD